MVEELNQCPAGFNLVYSLADDRGFIKDVQRASLDAGPFGIEPAYELFGSDDWWKAIATGKLQVHTIQGTVCSVSSGERDDYPTFKIQSDDGTVTANLTRLWRNDDENLDILYQVGRRVIWKYVELESRNRSIRQRGPVKQTLAICIKSG